MSKPRKIHILVRFSDVLLKDKDTIEEHNRVVRQYGAVWFGKMGTKIGRERIALLNDQIDENRPTFAYLIKGNRRKSTVFCANLIKIAEYVPSDEKQLLPSYYARLNIQRYMKSWMKLNEIMKIEFSELKRFHVASSVFPLVETLAKSSSGHFYIEEMRG